MFASASLRNDVSPSPWGRVGVGLFLFKKNVFISGNLNATLIVYLSNG
jgi:hypothetical protein